MSISRFYARVDFSNVVQSINRDSLMKWSIADGDWFEDEVVDDLLVELQEFPLTPRQAVRITRELRAGKKVVLNPIPDFLGGEAGRYSMHCDGEYIGILEREIKLSKDYLARFTNAF